MGLDSYWMHKGEEASVEGDFKICGGLMSGHGNSSFRGKVYDKAVEAITGVSLYQERIGNETVKEMTKKMQEASVPDEFDKEQWLDFVKMFQLHAEAGHELAGRW
jgi:hypothetical protein